MTEAEWFCSTDLYPMLEHIEGKTSDRKLRLFAIACCHRPYFEFDDERYRKAIQLAERMAEENVGQTEWRQYYEPAYDAAYELWKVTWDASVAAQGKAPRGTPEVEKLVWADMVTAMGWVLLSSTGWDAAYSSIGIEWDEEHLDEPTHQLVFLHDIFGNPFHPTTIDRSLLTPTVKTLAQKIYDDRAFDQLPLLADELEKAGCDNEEILGHCRESGPHVRGCWVVDLVLGKE